MGFSGHVLTMVAEHVSSPPCALEHSTLPKFWQRTELKHLLCLFTGKVSQSLVHIWDAGRMSPWCLPEPETVVGLRGLEWKDFLVPLSQQDANVSSGKSITFLTVHVNRWHLGRNR